MAAQLVPEECRVGLGRTAVHHGGGDVALRLNPTGACGERDVVRVGVGPPGARDHIYEDVTNAVVLVERGLEHRRDVVPRVELPEDGP
jgi:hypothetical protein